jgi:hypothetical protein
MELLYLWHGLVVMMAMSAYRYWRSLPPEYPEDLATLCGVASERFEINLLMDVFRLVPKKDRPRTFDDSITAPLMAATEITRQGKHGRVEGPFGVVYVYQSNEGFEGKDRFTLQSTYGGRRFTLNYRIFVSPDEAKPGRNWRADRERNRGRRVDCERAPFGKE